MQGGTPSISLDEIVQKGRTRKVFVVPYFEFLFTGPHQPLEGTDVEVAEQTEPQPEGISEQKRPREEQSDPRSFTTDAALSCPITDIAHAFFMTHKKRHTDTVGAMRRRFAVTKAHTRTACMPVCSAILGQETTRRCRRETEMAGCTYRVRKVLWS